jgi:hypothetical protein
MPAIGHSSHTPPAGGGDGDRRVAWLLNHTTLREFEVPLLRRLGLEVYCPKRFPRNADNRSASVSHEFDDSLTIPADELRTLNAFDFYSGDHPPEIRRILNERFRTVIVPYMFPLFTQALAYFHGRILLRTFGSTHPTYSYSSWAREVAAPAFERQLARASDRFWFAQAYPHLKAIEPPLFQRRAVDLPLGLPERITRNHETWTGSDPRILFVCPEIETYAESRQIYRDFKAHFGDLGHVICGAQSKPVGDPAVLGKVDAPTFDRLFRTCNVMVYHSRLPRHLHYHPLEAICYGMPLVYMQEGMLGRLTDRKLPGACDTWQEARDKVRRLIDRRDAALARDIRTSQEAIYRLFTAEHAAEQWRRGFVDGILSTAVPDRPRSGCVAVLPLDASEAVGAECRQIADRLRGGQAFGRAAGSVRPRVGSLTRWEPATNAATVVPFAWKPIAAASLLYAQRLSGHAKPVPHPQAAIPDDGVCDFMDCDAWIVVGDRCTTPVAAVKPYAFRHVRLASAPPLSREVHRSTAITLHNAAAVLVDTEAEQEALVRDYGLSPEWIVRLDQDATGECLWDTLKNMP